MEACRSSAAGIDIDINGAVGAHADILRKAGEGLRSRIVELLAKGVAAIVVMQVDIPAGDDLPGMMYCPARGWSWWGW